MTPDEELLAAHDARYTSPAAAQDTRLRNREHALLSHYAMDRYGPVGALAMTAAVPAYAGAKYVAQRWLPPAAGAALDDALMRIPGVQFKLAGASPVDWGQVWAGLQPIIQRYGGMAVRP